MWVQDLSYLLGAAHITTNVTHNDNAIDRSFDTLTQVPITCVTGVSFFLLFFVLTPGGGGQFTDQ